MLTVNVKKLVTVAAIITVGAFSGLSTTSAMAAAPMAKFSAPGFYRLMVGDFEVTALSDGTVDLPVEKLLKELASKTERELAKSFLKSPVETSVNAYLINTGSKLVLIDTGAGSLFGPTLRKLVANLKTSGYQPEQVDEIYITHFHPDHVGGLAADGKTTFPNAILRADKRESDYWLNPTNMEKAPADKKGFFQGATASVKPYVDDKKYQPFETNTELTPGIKSYSSYGHTEGHTSYIVESRDSKMIIIGDLIHVSAVQLNNPKVTIGFDTTPKIAAQARNDVFKKAAKEGDLVAAAHIQFPGLGHLRLVGNSYQWIPVNYTQMR